MSTLVAQRDPRHVLISRTPSYFATKQCTYTDASGRPVPAPHRFDPARANLLGPPPVDSGRTLPFTPSQPQPPANGSDPPRFASNHRILTAPPGQQPTSDSSDDDRRNGNGRKRFRNERGIAISPDDLVIDGPLMTTLDRPRAVELDHGLMRELTNCQHGSFFSLLKNLFFYSSIFRTLSSSQGNHSQAHVYLQPQPQ